MDNKNSQTIADMFYTSSEKNIKSKQKQKNDEAPQKNRSAAHSSLLNCWCSRDRAGKHFKH
jgi:hypothetical protein